MEALTSETKNQFHISNSQDEKSILQIGYALSSPERLKILKSLLYENKSLATLSHELDIPPTSLSRHIDILTNAKLIFLNYQPGPKGHTKHCALASLGFSVSFNQNARVDQPTLYSVELPIGVFSHCHIEQPCGMLSKDSPLAPFDTPNCFFIPERIYAECLWFDRGFISYNFPSPDAEKLKKASQISFSFEICSETHCYNNEWPSDITVYINKVEICTFTSPGDFGGRRGKYTPAYWPITSTQFGMLKRITVDKTGIYVDNQLIDKRDIFDELRLFEGSAIQLTIGIKDDAIHKGGINLFGKNFGDYPQGIIMTISASPENK